MTTLPGDLRRGDRTPRSALYVVVCHPNSYLCACLCLYPSSAGGSMRYTELDREATIINRKLAWSPDS